MGDEVHLVSFRVGRQVFAFSVFEVERIVRYEDPVRVPKTPAWVEGVIKHQGEVVPILDLRKRLLADAEIDDDATRIMVLEWKEGRIGVVVDEVTEVVRVPAAEIAQPTAFLKGVAATFVQGIVTHLDRPIVLLNPAKLFTSKERLALKSFSVSV